MKLITHRELLKDKRVIEEIHRHLWIESEKVGQDIGFERASQDWLERFSKAWMDYHMPKSKLVKNVIFKKFSTQDSEKKEYSKI